MRQTIKKHFGYILTGLHKQEIFLDLTESNRVINVIIGKMGTCKSVILGQLQPFATFGTLDERNQDDPILPEKNGLKEISFKDGNNIYKIRHDYQWKNDKHVIKSYFTKNGEELNLTGSTTNFKTLVFSNLGLEQSMMPFLRLGSNVTNLIDMKTADRKAFINSMLSDTAVYTMLYKKLNDDLRLVNSQITVLTNKMAKASKGDIDAVKNEYTNLRESIASIENENKAINKEIDTCLGQISYALNGQSLDAFSSNIETQENRKKDLETEAASLKNKIDAIRRTHPTMLQLVKDQGNIEAQIAAATAQSIKYDQEYRALIIDIDSARKQLLVSQNIEQIDSLKEQFEDILINMIHQH